ncbi:MAG: nucleotide excision repair endonuclease, partial [Planctomycetota bacterium]
MGGRLEDYLRDHPEGVTAEDAARDALGLSGPPALVAKLAEPALAGVPGAKKGPDGLWRTGAAPDLPVIAAVVVADGPQPGIDAVLAVGLAADDGVLRSVTGPVPDVDVADLAVRIAASRVVVFDSDRYLPHLGVKPKAVTKLKPVLRRAERIGGADGLAEAAAAFGVVVPESDDPGDTALALDRLWRAAMAAGLDPATTPAPPAPFDFDSVGFGPELLEEIPDRPGVYRFLDEDGELLYVGKAKNLRQRVGSYFSHRSKRRKKFPELM